PGGSPPLPAGSAAGSCAQHAGCTYPVHVLDAGSLPGQQAGTADQELLAAERHAALCDALSRLPQDGQQLIALLIADPPVPYAEISTRLGIPVGSIGPKRSGCLDRLRRDPALTALINAADAA